MFMHVGKPSRVRRSAVVPAASTRSRPLECFARIIIRAAITACLPVLARLDPYFRPLFSYWLLVLEECESCVGPKAICMIKEKSAEAADPGSTPDYA